jgi:uncharacterized membrane protein
MNALATQDGILFLLTWVMMSAGVAWFGTQWTLDWVLRPAVDDPVAALRPWSGAPLWWLRWSAMVTMLAAWGTVVLRSDQGVPFKSPFLTLFLTAAALGSTAWFNVWFVLWPNARLALDQHPEDARARTRAARAICALGTNSLLTLPLLFFAGAAHGLPSIAGSGRSVPERYWLAVAALVGIVELNALLRPHARRPLLSTPTGAVLGGIALTTLLFAAIVRFAE